MHVAIILDGNRRYARAQKKAPWVGHSIGAQRAGQLIEWCNELGVDELTMYTFSIENFNRPKKEIDRIFSLFKKNIRTLKNEKRPTKKELSSPVHRETLTVSNGDSKRYEGVNDTN